MKADPSQSQETKASQKGPLLSVGDFFEGPPKGVPLIGRGGASVGGVRRHGEGQEGTPSEEARPAKGRVAVLRPAALQPWQRLKQGDRVDLPWFGEDPLVGITHLRMEDLGWVRFGGELEGGRGSFALSVKEGAVHGLILLPEVGVGLEIRTQPGGVVVLVERPLDALQCWPAMAAGPAAADTGSGGTTVSTEEGVPQINTRPGARGLIYIDFRGGVATDPVWNFGQPIAFRPTTLTASGMQEVVERVAEDYAPFDIAISTIWADYEAAPVGRRTRVIVTPTDTALRGSGGVAMVNGWSSAGIVFSSTVPAWVFTSTSKQIAEGVSHEAGHTFGLNHDGTQTADGRTALAYYKGHGGDLTDPLSWAPIMGESYTRSQTQWSRGEYLGANNKEDDIAIIKRKTNGVGYIDESFVTTRPLLVVGGSFDVTGVVHHSETSVVYTFATLGGTLSASAKPALARYGNTDLKMAVSDNEGKVWAISDIAATTSAQVNVVLPEGAYTIAVSAGCTGPKPWDGYANGYPTYGAIGRFALTGTIENPVVFPDLTSPQAALGLVGEPFLYRPRITEGAVIAQCVTETSFGLEWDSKAGVLKGIPLKAGVFNAGFSIQEGLRRVNRNVLISVHADGLPVLAVGTATKTPLTTPEAPWRTQFEVLPWASVPGAQGPVSSSGPTADGGASRLRYSVPAGSVVQFRWKVSSESGCDFLECRINGLLARDRDTGDLLKISGVRDWSKQCVQVGGDSVLEFVYRKDFSLSEEQDRGWLAGLEIGQRPLFTKIPESVRLQPGESSFLLEAAVERATSLQWKKDGLTLVDGETGGRHIEGARSAELNVTGASAADAGTYVLEASNAFGMTTSRRVEVGVPGVPVVSQKISAGTGVKVGDTLLLSVGVSSVKPFFVVWSKDGIPIRWTQTTYHPMREADFSMSGRYSAVVVNAYGSVSAGEVNVQVR